MLNMVYDVEDYEENSTPQRYNKIFNLATCISIFVNEDATFVIEIFADATFFLHRLDITAGRGGVILQCRKG